MRLNSTVYFAPNGFLHRLIDELREVEAVYGRLVLAGGKAQKTHWAQNLWFEPEMIPIDSIGDAAKKLRAIQRNWAPYLFHLFRRGHLIQELLPRISSKPHDFPFTVPITPMGSWTLLEKNAMIASAKCSSPFPNGEIHFNENKIDPPSRAYLKLWELFTRIQTMPRPDDLCLDAGSSPGGWTWVLHKLRARVISVDRTPLESRVMRLPRVRFIRHNAFSLTPDDIGEVDWVFSDIVAYPEKLWKWIAGWLESGNCSRFVCTVKLQGEPDRSVIERFDSVPGSQLIHLFHNRHELTWVKIGDR